MKTTLSLGLIVAAASTLVACSSDEGGDRDPVGGAAGQTASGGAAGQASGGAGGGSSGAAGAPAGGAGGAGGAAPVANTGPAFVIAPTEDPDGAGPLLPGATVVDATGSTLINGNTFLTQSAEMTVDATVSHRAGGLCFSGTTAVVPDANSYGTYWGAELGLNLKVITDPNAAPVADAGADAGGPVQIPDPAGWAYGNVIGFSYKLVGNDPAAADKGVPASRLRFKAIPVGSLGTKDNYCSDRTLLVDGSVENVLFSDITFECWTPGNPSIGPAEPTINVVTTVGPPRVVGTPPNPKALNNISWQIASDVAATTPLPIAFNFCITDLKPILAP